MNHLTANLSGVFIGISNPDRNGDQHLFRSFSLSKLVLDPTWKPEDHEGEEHPKVFASISFTGTNAPLLDSNGESVTAPNRYVFPFRTLVRAKDKITGEPVTKEDGTPCYKAVFDEEACDIAAAQAIAAGRPVTNSAPALVRRKGESKPARDTKGFHAKLGLALPEDVIEVIPGGAKNKETGEPITKEDGTPCHGENAD